MQKIGYCLLLSASETHSFIRSVAWTAVEERAVLPHLGGPVLADSRTGSPSLRPPRGWQRGAMPHEALTDRASRCAAHHQRRHHAAAAPHATRCIIVHPRFRHTLVHPPMPVHAPRRADWRDLPTEVVELIAGHLDKAQDLLSLAAVCRDARPLARSDTVWKGLCRRRFGVPEQPGGEAMGSPQPGFWLELYRYNHQVFMDMVRRGSGAMDFARFGAGPMIIQLV